MQRITMLVTGLFLLTACVRPPVKPILSGTGSGAALSSDPDPLEGPTPEGDSSGTEPAVSGPSPAPVIANSPGAKPTSPAPAPTGSKPSTPKTTPAPFVASAPLSKDLMAKATGFTKSNKTVMGSWFDKAVSVRISDADKRFLEDPAQNVPIPVGTDWVYKKYSVNLYPSGGRPHPADGMQTAIGDCNMLAMFNSFAYQHPDFLKSLIKDRGNGSYEITLFNPQAQRIVVAVDSNFLADRSGNLVAVRGVNASAIWLTVMEKAIMKYNHIYKIWDGDGPGKVEGFGSEAGAPMLTGEGQSYAFDRGALASPKDLTRVVKEALKAGKLITGGYGESMVINGLKSITGHAYTVLVPPNDQTMIAMRNPWGVSPKAAGGDDNSHDGILDIGFIDAWFKTIDLRVMEPGLAGGTGNTGPYQPRLGFREIGFSAEDMNFMNLSHARSY